MCRLYQFSHLLLKLTLNKQLVETKKDLGDSFNQGKENSDFPVSEPLLLPLVHSSVLAYLNSKAPSLVVFMGLSSQHSQQDRTLSPSLLSDDLKGLLSGQSQNQPFARKGPSGAQYSL